MKKDLGDRIANNSSLNRYKRILEKELLKMRNDFLKMSKSMCDNTLMQFFSRDLTNIQ